MDIFPGRVIPVTSKLVLRWLPCQAHGVIGSVLGLVSPVSGGMTIRSPALDPESAVAG